MNTLPPPYYDHAGITLYHGDCRELLPLLGEFDLLLTDPPYGIGANKMTLGNRKGQVYRGSEDWDSEPVSVDNLLHGPYTERVIWGGNYFEVPPSRCWLVWDKGTGNNDFADCELAWTDIDSVVKKTFKSWVGANARERHEGERFHPTQKPIEVMAWCIGVAKKSPGSIVDPYSGSGTTLVAAKQLGLRAVGIERDETFCRRAVQRLSQDCLF